MGVYDPVAKDTFASESKSQNFARLLSRVVQRVHTVLNSSRLLDSACNIWSSKEVNVAGDKCGPRCDTQAKEGGQVVVTPQRLIDRADLRLCFWQSVRECREIILKVLVLINVLEQPGYQAFMDQTIEIIARLLDGREALRTCSLEFAPIQWPPRGTAEPPCAPYAVDVAIDILAGGGQYPRLPVLLEQVVKQTGEPEVAVALSLSSRVMKALCCGLVDISYVVDTVDEERSKLQNRIEEEMLAMWALSSCPKDQAHLSFQNGKLHFSVPYEFDVTAIFDLQRFQIIEARILVGSGAYGLEVPGIINIGFRNVLCQAIGLVEARYRFTVERMKRSIRETWRQIVDGRSQGMSKENPSQLTTLELRAQTLERDLADLLLFENAALADDHPTSLTAVQKKNCENSLAICPVTQEEGSAQNNQSTGPQEAWVESTAPPSASESADALVSSYDTDVVTHPLTTGDSSKGPPDYFAELLRMGRWISGAVVLAVLRDQVLRAKNFPSVFPGGVFSSVEHGRRDTTDVDGDDFRALDIYLSPYFDFSCGDLLTPLLTLLLESPTLRNVFPGGQYLYAMLSAPGDQGPSLIERTAATTEQPSQWELSGSGALLRIALDGRTARWETIVWPLTPVAWLLDFMSQIKRKPENKIGERETLQEALQGTLLFDVTLLQRALQMDASWSFLRSFDARRLELSTWTRHTAASLATLSLGTLAAYLQNPRLTSIYTEDVELQIGNEFGGDRSCQLSGQMLQWTYFKKYTVELQVSPFDGTLRITFRSLERSIPSWPRLGNSSLDSQIAAAVGSGAGGMSGLVKMLPYLKCLAFLQLCREVFADHGWAEAPHQYLDTIDDEPKDVKARNRSSQQRPLGSISGGWHFATSVQAETVEQPTRVAIVQPADGVEMTRLLHFFRETFDAQGHLEWSLLLELRRAANAAVCLRVVMRDACEVASTQLLALCVTSEPPTVIARFSLPVSGVTLLQPDDSGFCGFSLRCRQYITHVEAALSAVDMQLAHAVAFAEFPPGTFPLRLSSVMMDNDLAGDSFSFTCVPSGSKGIALWRNLSWVSKEMPHLVKTPAFRLCVTRTLSTTQPAEISVCLRPADGVRLPAFFSADVVITASSVPFGKDAIIQFNSGIEQLPHKWFYTSDFTLRIQKPEHDTVAASYQLLARYLMPLGFFIKGCRELQRLQQLRRDIVVRTALPSKLDVIWVPWALHTSAPQATLPHSWASTPHLNLPPVRFVWELHSEASASQDTVTVSYADVSLSVHNYLLTPVLRASSDTLIGLLNNDFRVSPWTVMRYIISVFELHASISLLVAHNDPLLYRNLPTHAYTTRETKLQPPHTFWTRGSQCNLGAEELVLNLLNTASPVSAPVPRIVESIQLFFTVSSSTEIAQPTTNLFLPNAVGTPLCVKYYARVSTATSFQTALGVMARSLDDAFMRFGEAFSTAFQSSVGLPPAKPPSSGSVLPSKGSVLPASLLPLWSPARPGQEPPSKLASDTATYQAYVAPTRLLESFLVPLLDGVVVWLNAITAAASVNIRSTMARSGALLFAKGPGPASTPLPEASRGPRGVVSVGCVRWQHSTTDAVPPLAEKNVASLGNSTATPAPPNVTAPPARLSASLDRASPGSSGATLLHPHDDPSSNSTQHNPTHTLELLLVPSLGSIIESPVSLRFRRQEVISSRDPLLMGTASVAACGTLSATRALLSDALCFAFWEVVQYYTRNVPTSLSDVKEYTRLAWDGWHNWPREFNVLLFPSLLSTTALQDFDAECTIKAVSSCLVAYQTFHDDFLRIWRQEIASASENGQEAEIEMPASIVSQAESVILLSYFDLCPDALLLPYDVRLLQRAETEEMSSSSRSSPSFPLRRKRRRGSSLDSSVSAQLKRFCCEDLSNSASALFPEKFGVANGFDHDAGRLPKCDNGQPGGNQNDTTDDDRVLPDEKVVQAEICVCEPSAVSELHETALRHAASTLWLAPLKPHGALRADKREVALHFSCALELRTAPATMEWSVISKYFRLFASQMACDDFSILVRFFQRSPSPIAAVGDLAGLLDLATATADLHLDHLQRTAQWIAAGKSVGGQSDAPLDLTQCPPLPATPFVQLSFHKVASNRSSNVPVLDVYITVWSCLPFLSQYLHVMLANADEAKAGPVASDGASLPVMSEQREQLLRQQFTASSFNFILSLPLPTTDASQVIVNGQYDLETVLENLAQTMLRRKPTSSGMLSLSLHRPLSKGLAKLFSPGHTYSVLQATLETPTRPPANSSAAEIR